MYQWNENGVWVILGVMPCTEKIILWNAAVLENELILKLKIYPYFPLLWLVSQQFCSSLSALIPVASKGSLEKKTDCGEKSLLPVQSVKLRKPTHCKTKCTEIPGNFVTIETQYYYKLGSK